MNHEKKQLGLRSALASTFAVGLASLPNVTCPACWPAYAGILGTLGVPLSIGNAFVMPLTVLFLTIAVGSMAFRAQRRRGYGPFVVGAGAAIFIIAGKFVFGVDSIAYGGIGLLIFASIWNSRSKRGSSKTSCPACVDQRDTVQLQVVEKIPEIQS